MTWSRNSTFNSGIKIHNRACYASSADGVSLRSAGRPAADKVRVVGYVPREMEAEIRGQAAAEFRAMSDQVHYLLHLGLKAKKESGDQP